MYTIIRSDGNVLTTIADTVIDTTSTSLSLPGKNFSSYGQPVDTNFVRMLENFSATTVPENPIRGQIWFNISDPTNPKLLICPQDGELNSANWLTVLSTNVNGDFIIDPGNISAPNGNITGNNLSASNLVQGQFGIIYGLTESTSTTTGALIIGGGVGIAKNLNVGGNLTVDGDTTYVNVTTLAIEDPIISLGNGPNNAPLTSNDGKDRGSLLNYYTAAPVQAFMGWDNSGGEFIFGKDVTVVSDVVTVNEYGNTRANVMFATTANISGNANVGGNLNLTGAFALTGNIVITAVTPATSTTTGALQVAGGAGFGGNVYIGGNANITGVANITGGANLGGPLRVTSTTAATSTTTGAAIISGGVGIGGNAYIGGNANVTGTANIGGRLLVADTTAATSSTTGAAVIAGGAGIGGNLYVGGNISGAFIAPGANTQVMYNDTGLINGDAKFTFNEVTGNVTSSGSFVSTVATGTAPLGVTSTTRVSSLYVQGANEANIQLVSAGTFYLDFSSATSGNLVLNANAQFTVDVATGTLTAPKISGNLTGNVTVPGASGDMLYNNGGNIDAAAGVQYIAPDSITVTGTVIAANISTPILDADGGAGVVQGAWTLSAGSSLQATYADLAERHHSDTAYPVGTVMTVGGVNEVTACADHDSCVVLGVVSNAYAYLMNAHAGNESTHPAIAYVGRVPVRVIGPVNKGDRIRASNGGLASVSNSREGFGWALETNPSSEEKLVLCIIK